VITPEHLHLDKKITIIEEPVIVELNYDVPHDISTIKSMTLDKNREINGIITGIKGQYIFLGENVFNMRRHEGYIVDFEVSSPI
jgi:hypothetical protein